MVYILIFILSILIVILYLCIISLNKNSKETTNKEGSNKQIKEETKPDIDIIKDSVYKDYLNKFNKDNNKLLVPIGLNEEDNIETIDLLNTDNIIIFGTTGGGKSVILNSIISSIIMNYSSSEVKFLTIDSSIVELSSFNKIPHYIKDTISNMTDASNELEKLSKNLDNIIKSKEHLIVVIDDLYDLSYEQESYINNLLIDLLKRTKNTNIHFIIATDTPVNIDKNLLDLIDTKMYLTLSPGTYKDIKSKYIKGDDLDYLNIIGNMIYINNNTKKRIKVVEIKDNDIKEIVKHYTK